MPTVYQRLQGYRKLPEAVHFSNKKLNKLYQLLKRIYDKYPTNPPITYVDSVEGEITYNVRDYPAQFQPTIDNLIWKFHLNIVARLAAEAAIQIPVPDPPKKEKRKRESIIEKPVEKGTTKRKRFQTPAFTGRKP